VCIAGAGALVVDTGKPGVRDVYVGALIGFPRA